MKTFIVYSLDSGLPIAVGEAIKAEWARIETAEKTKSRAENLIAEEIAIELVGPSQNTRVSSVKESWNKPRGNK